MSKGRASCGGLLELDERFYGRREIAFEMGRASFSYRMGSRGTEAPERAPEGVGGRTDAGDQPAKKKSDQLGDRWYMSLEPIQRAGLIEQLESLGKKRNLRLQELGLPRATYYRWRRRYKKGGTEAWKRGEAKELPSWNCSPARESLMILRVAKDHPELSSWLLAVKITDEEEFSASESRVYRVLKAHGLIEPRPLEDMPAEKVGRHKTQHPDEIWQCDATNLFVVGWGYYKAILVIDDYSRKILSCPVKPNETSMSISDAVEEAIEAAKKEGHILETKPRLLSDNGSGFTGKVLESYLNFHEIPHIFGKPFHPQTQGKVEAFNKKLKKKVCLWVYCSPEDLSVAVEKSVREYNNTPHEALKNVSPNDMYAGRQEEILKRRKEKKQLTREWRKRYNQAIRQQMKAAR